MEQTQLPIDKLRLREFTAILERYANGKAATQRRILESEKWWKLRAGPADPAGGFVSRSGWLHNVIVSKHADAMESFPQPLILPREPSDEHAAAHLSAIVPCVLEQCRFEEVYSDIMWQKLKTGTGVYKVVWDSDLWGGLGDIRIQKVDLLSIFWEPGICDIQKSPYFFHTELCSREQLQEQYPDADIGADGFVGTRLLWDEGADTTGKVTVIEVYYRKGGILHYCRYAGDTVLYATENDPAMAAGLYDHGMYPFVFDTLFPLEGSACGYGFVDLCRNPQTEIDMLKTAFIKNAMVGTTPRYFARTDGAVNEEEFLDLSRPIVHVAGNLSDDTLKPIAYTPLANVYVDVLKNTVEELRQTSGNTQTGTGVGNSGVTAASAIAALQQASGKGSRDATQTSYRAFCRVVWLCIELIRQFYALPRQFRITGQNGTDYLRYSNEELQPQQQGDSYGCRLPIFDIRVSARHGDSYGRAAQNELALKLYQLGFFESQNRQKALNCLALMDFEGKQTLLAGLND